MKLEQIFDLFIDGYTPADIVREIDLTESDARDIAIKVNVWLEELQREANVLDSYKRFFSE
jgi:hypothetical protein